MRHSNPIILLLKDCFGVFSLIAKVYNKLKSTYSQWAATPANKPPMVWASIALEISFLYPKESSIAVCVERNPLQHIPIAVHTAMALPFTKPSSINLGIRLKAAPTAPRDVIGNATNSVCSNPNNHSKTTLIFPAK